MPLVLLRLQPVGAQPGQLHADRGAVHPVALPVGGRQCPGLGQQPPFLTDGGRRVAHRGLAAGGGLVALLGGAVPALRRPQQVVQPAIAQVLGLPHLLQVPPAQARRLVASVGQLVAAVRGPVPDLGGPVPCPARAVSPLRGQVTCGGMNRLRLVELLRIRLLVLLNVLARHRRLHC
ncbi:hypothetical protein [Nonomuraea gerenzanensis]|uniref:hypothetical protein n=1 Tax=Nonomuraea gerenzanensis TaxID=93944 RepID=UPI001CD94147|nr:hypothetical protein [Nonomuraea gerenzanensis]UBU13080.1 hypothetical protein LCN96_54065 [Nonomuraea gerenzanensis]